MQRRVPRTWLVAIVLLAAAGGCKSFRPQPLTESTFWDRVETRADGPVTVSVGVLSTKEARRAFGVKMHKKGIEPVWLRIENNDDVDYGFFPITLDPDYFSPYEAAWKCHSFGGSVSNRKMDQHFDDLGIPMYVNEGDTIEGIVYTNLLAVVMRFRQPVIGSLGLPPFLTEDSSPAAFTARAELRSDSVMCDGRVDHGFTSCRRAGIFRSIR